MDRVVFQLRLLKVYVSTAPTDPPSTRTSKNMVSGIWCDIESLIASMRHIDISGRGICFPPAPDVAVIV